MRAVLMTSNRCPLVSVGLPVFNGGDTIEAALDSLLSQTYTNIEVLVSDNASTDATREICEQTAIRDPRVEYVRQPKNLGPFANSRFVLERAKGDYFMWLGHDDWLSDRYIEACADTLTKEPEVASAGGLAIYHREGVEVFRGDVVQLTQESPQERVAEYYRVVTDNGIFYAVMRREQLLKLRMKSAMGGDWLMVAAMAFLGKVVTVPSVTVHRERGGISQSYESIASSLGLSRFQAMFPHVAIAYFVVWDIVWADPLYTLPVSQRVRLAWSCQRSIRVRHGASLWDIIRKIMSLGKQQVTSMIGGGGAKGQGNGGAEGDG